MTAVELRDAEQLARYSMALHGLHDWHFRFDKATRRFGCCDYTRRTISLSRQITLLNDADRVRATILHEVAHALAGPAAGHGKRWRDTALSIGADGRRCYGDDVRLPPKRKPAPAAPPPARKAGGDRRTRRVFAVTARGVVTLFRKSGAL